MVLPLLGLIAGGALLLWRLTKHQCPNCGKLVDVKINICHGCRFIWNQNNYI